MVVFPDSLTQTNLTWLKLLTWEESLVSLKSVRAVSAIHRRVLLRRGQNQNLPLDGGAPMMKVQGPRSKVQGALEVRQSVFTPGRLTAMGLNKFDWLPTCE